MMKLLFQAISIFCIATIGTLFVGTGYLSYQGSLTADSFQDIQSILQGKDPVQMSLENKDDETPPSFEEIAAIRAKKILHLSEREAELELVKQTIDRQITELAEQRKRLDKQHAAFKKTLKETEERLTSEAQEMSRGILLKMKPDAAAQNLLALEHHEAIDLLKGMSEKDVALILSKFPPQRAGEAEKLFISLYRGKPKQIAIDSAKSGLKNKTPTPSSAQAVPQTATQ